MFGDLEKEDKEDLINIIDSMPWSVSIYDSNARIIMVNRKLCENVQSAPEDWIGKSAEQIKSEGYIDNTIVTEAIEKRKEVYGITHSRTGVEGLSVCQPVFNNNGNIKFLVVSSPAIKDIQDIQLIVEEQSRQAKMYVREIEHLRNFLLLNKDDIFRSPSMKSILHTVKQISYMDCTVLITGESGVGKEVVAKIIHNNSTRKDRPFIPVNISAIPETLLESELYGYKKGAFTGASKEGKIGLFEVASGGTLFLDEVGDIPMRMQVKILRAIDSGEISRIGSTALQKIDIRIMAATNRDLKDQIKKGTFREDLYYRLNVVPIKINPLRERPEDIWPLCDHFLERLNRKYHMKKTFAPGTLDRIKMYDWPGNVRELRNVVERLAVLSQTDEISVQDFNALVTGLPPKDYTTTPLQNYEAYEQSLILSALKQSNGNKSKAAQILGMHRSKLYRKLGK
ncbi:MAG: sigma-54 interaction domain-containing protein [Smithellaceae bacterium]